MYHRLRYRHRCDYPASSVTAYITWSCMAHAGGSSSYQKNLHGAHLGIVEAHHGAVGAQNGAMEATTALDAHHGAVKAHHDVNVGSP